MSDDDTLVLGIDIGTSGVRIAAVDGHDEMVAVTAAAMVAPERNGGRIQQDPAVWSRAVDEAMAGLGRAIDLGRVRALAVDGTSGTVVAIDGAGHPCGPASLYNDVCTAETSALITRHVPPGSAAGGATSALGRALDLSRAFPGAVRIVHQADWIAGRFSGFFDLTDENNALKTGYDPVTRAWPAWIDSMGMDRALLPRAVPAGAVMSPVDEHRAPGLRGDTLVVAGTTDGCAAFLATGAETPGDGVTSLGTTLVLKLLCDMPIFAPRYGIYSHRIGDDWLAGGASNSGGAALLSFFTAARMAELEPALKPEASTGFDFYPLPGTGERFPINDPSLTSRVEPRPADDAQFLQALFEGIGTIEKLGYDCLEALGGPPLRSIRSVGGGARNRAWSTIRARTLGVPLLASRHAEAACGAARLARRGYLAEGVVL